MISCTFKMCGLTESEADEILNPLRFTHKPAAFTLSYRNPDLALVLSLPDREENKELLEHLRCQIRERLGDTIYAEADVTLEEVVGQMLSKKQQTLSIAESCTGGYISHRITRIPGSSDYFVGSMVTYSNETKVRLLGVSPATLQLHGAVSRQTALEMAAGIKERCGTVYGLSVTGIAGPAGGSPAKPVGTVWIGIARPKGAEARLFNFSGAREEIIMAASQTALNCLRTTIRAEPGSA